jgi:hypothetical protein
MRLDSFALLLHNGRIGLEQLERQQRHVAALFLHLGVEGAVSEVSTSICWVSAPEKKLWNTFAALGLDEEL